MSSFVSFSFSFSFLSPRAPRAPRASLFLIEISVVSYFDFAFCISLSIYTAVPPSPPFCFCFCFCPPSVPPAASGSPSPSPSLALPLLPPSPPSTSFRVQMSSHVDSIALRALLSESERWSVLGRQIAVLEAEIDDRLKRRASEMRREMSTLFHEAGWTEFATLMMGRFERDRLAKIDRSKKAVEDVLASVAAERLALRASIDRLIESVVEQGGGGSGA
jgi:hypothetical protein